MRGLDAGQHRIQIGNNKRAGRSDAGARFIGGSMIGRINKAALTRPQLQQLQTWINARDDARPASHPGMVHNRIDGRINADASIYAGTMRFLRIARNK